jgi:hypothetical protein
MSNKLTLILFSYDSEKSIVSSLPSEASLASLLSKNSSLDVTIMVFDPQIKSYTSEKIILINKPLYDWSYDNPVDNIEGYVYFIAITEEKEVDMYSVMEEVETQKYNQRRYFSDSSEIKLKNYIKIWREENPYLEDVNGESINPTSPKNIKDSKIYQLYSGVRISRKISTLDRNAICWRIILLAEHIKFFLSVAFSREYDIEEMRKLPDKDEGYVKNFLRISKGEKPKKDEKMMKPFYSNEEVSSMVENSYYFQAEDPILKGFILAHPVQVVQVASEFKESLKMPPVSPLDIGRDIQYLIFNHGQFRQELLISMMKVVAAFSAKNGFLTEKDIPRKVKPKKKEAKTSKKKEVIKVIKKKGVTITSGILQAVEAQEEDEDIVVEETVNNVYYTQELWTTIIKRIKAKIQNEKED